MQQRIPSAVVTLQGREIHIAPLTEADIAEVARLNQDVEIKDSNYRYRLTPGDPDALNITGGMFVVSDGAHLRQVIADPQESMAVARLSTGELLATDWYSRMDPHFARPGADSEGLALQLFPQYAGLANELRPENEKIIYARELIANHKAGVHNLTFVMLLYYQSVMERLGYEKTLYEIYKVLRYSDALGEYDVNMLNERSFAAMTHNGGLHIGCHERFELTKRDYFGKPTFTALIEPQVILWNVQDSVRVLNEKLEALGGRMKWREPEKA